MQTLTAEKASQLFKDLQYANAQRGLTIKEEYFKQSLEISLQHMQRDFIDFDHVARIVSGYDWVRLTVKERADVLQEVFRANNYV